MDNPWSDDDRQQQKSEAAISKKLKITIIMLSLVLMILLLPLASDFGLPLFRPVGASLLQRLWDAMRFIAMTAAISVGIISTSNSHNHDKEPHGSSHPRSSSSLHKLSKASIGSTSREEFNPHVGDIGNSFRSDYFSHALHPPDGDDENGNFRGKATQNGSLQKIKGKEVMRDLIFHADSSPESVPSPISPFGGKDFENINRFGFTSCADNSSNQGSASASKKYRQVVEDRTEIEGYGVPSSMLPSVNNTTTKVDRKKKSLTGMENDVRNRKGKNPVMKLDDNYAKLKMSKNAISPGADENYDEKGRKHQRASSVDRRSIKCAYDQPKPELRMRKDAMARLADEYHEEKAGKHRRSSSVDRQKPKYIYDQQSPDQPGLKQILLEMSKERSSKFKMTDSHTSRNEAYQASEASPEQIQAPVLIAPTVSDVASTSSVKQPLRADVLHQAMTVDFPSDAIAIEKHADAKTMGIGQKQQNAINASFMESFQREADAGKEGLSWADQNKHGNVPQLLLTTDHEKAKAKQSFNTTKHQVNQADHVNKIQVQKQVDAAHVASTHQNIGGDDNTDIDLQSSLHRKADQTVASKEKLIASNRKHALQRWNDAQRTFEGEDMQRHHGYGEGSKIQLHKGNASRLLRQSSQHSRSELDLELLRKSDQMKEQTVPLLRTASRDRKSFSYDFGDSFDPNWFLALEPPPPPQLLGTSPEGQQQLGFSMSNAELRNIMATSFVESLVPWRSPTPDIPSIQRSVSPLEALSLAQGTYPSRQELKERSDKFISNFHSKLSKQRQQASLERQARDHG